MKLTKDLEASDYKLQPNVLYDSFYANILKIVYAQTPDFKHNNYSFDISKKEWNVIIDNEDKEFYTKNYFPVIETDTATVQNTNNFDIPDKYKHCVGKAEIGILNFIFNGGNRMKLIGKEGWGKTTLLRFICNLIPDLQKVKKHCVPIYLSFNTMITDLSINLDNLSELQRKEIYDKILYDKMLLNEMRHYTKKLLQSEINSNFYQYVLKRADFTKELMQYENINTEAINGWITSDERDKRWHNLRVELSEKKEIVLSSFSYLNKIGIIPLLIFDDLDPLNLEFHKYIYNETFALTHDKYNMKVILSMRPRINGRLENCTQVAIRINTLIELSHPNISKYLEGKDTRIEETVKSMDKIEIITKENDFRIIPNDIETFFKNYLNILLQSDIRNFIANISGGNMRVCNELIHIYLMSGFINSAELIANIIKKNYNNPSLLLPQWIVYSSIITHNHQTVFGQKDSDNAVDHKVYPVNILCNGDGPLNHLLLRFHLLSMFVKTGTAHTIEGIKAKYKNIVTEQVYHDISFNRSFNRAIKRLKNGGLIGSPNCGFIENFDDIKSEHEFVIEDLGKYYIKQIIKIFEYLSFMKDDTEFGSNPLDIKSCIKVKRHIDRFTEVVKYLQHLYNEEMDFFRKLDNNQILFYKENFSPLDTSKTFYVQVLIDNMLDYVRQRIDMMINRGELEAGTRNDLSTLSENETKLKQMADNCRIFLKAYEK